jgi:hypothetical protein
MSKAVSLPAETEYTHRFVLRHWHPISREEAGKRNPRFLLDVRLLYFYECDQFDGQTNRCRAYDERPEVCRGFPWYSGSPDKKSLLFWRRCSYWHDVPWDDWPVDIEPLPSPEKPPAQPVLLLRLLHKALAEDQRHQFDEEVVRKMEAGEL